MIVLMIDEVSFEPSLFFLSFYFTKAYVYNLRIETCGIKNNNDDGDDNTEKNVENYFHSLTNKQIETKKKWNKLF